jgi:hypothetical protein
VYQKLHSDFARCISSVFCEEKTFVTAGYDGLIKGLDLRVSGGSANNVTSISDGNEYKTMHEYEGVF